MTGSVADAEDACQDAWLRWQAVDHDIGAFGRGVPRQPGDARSRSTGCAQRSHRREAYVGPFLPEPIVETGPLHDSTTTSDPERSSELADSLTFAFLVLLDELGPEDRAVFLLHDVFGYSFDEVADAVGKSPAACRQTASRARRRIEHDRVDLRRADDAHERRVLDGLMAAMITGDIPGLMALLSPDVVQLDDGGPNRRAGRRPIVGPDRVARLMVNLAKRMPPHQTFGSSGSTAAPASSCCSTADPTSCCPSSSIPTVSCGASGRSSTPTSSTTCPDPPPHRPPASISAVGLRF